MTCKHGDRQQDGAWASSRPRSEESLAGRGGVWTACSAEQLMGEKDGWGWRDDASSARALNRARSRAGKAQLTIWK